MKKLSLLILLPLSAVAVSPAFKPETVTQVAKPVAPEQTVVRERAAGQLAFSLDELAHNLPLCERVLNLAIAQRRYDVVARVLPVYRTFAGHDPILVLFAQGAMAKSRGDFDAAVAKFEAILARNPQLNPVRIELATALFESQQNNAARAAFERAQEFNPPAEIHALINHYLRALDNRERWQINANANYLRTHNVNNTSSERRIESTGFIKNDDMLPQSAHGLAYAFNLAKDWNLRGHYYLAFENNLFGKYYWDNKDYNDVLNRTLVGLAHKSAVQSVRLLPFAEWRWVAGSRYQRGLGVRAEWNRWLSDRWQLSLAGEYAKAHYPDNPELNGFNQLGSATLLWLAGAKTYLYTGVDFNREKTATRRLANDTKTLRVGIGQEWPWNIATRVGISVAKRDYKAPAKLGGILPLGKVRSDTLYNANLTVWKRDWQWQGFTPKVQLSWKKQRSNLPTLYSYTEKNINLVITRDF
ncbi:DUF560 domain-containing protein [Pasteurellaceae bacterium HPA106]|uniref:surface lipoprotein assembly modifier n=1 Tax=Spirabiliibacterium pneumoniae TaxID=221400 RepID=UPI001AADC6A8|nr:surface lipoprotein assembly modifier [Spirabiliibacterium pneumoniae]MBE2897180.1 DUF560 domain-containing protein [Spirabiliibacterium pneumoniae]